MKVPFFADFCRESCVSLTRLATSQAPLGRRRLGSFKSEGELRLDCLSDHGRSLTATMAPGESAMAETKDRDKLFADLEALTEEQIEVGLAAGVWSEQVRPLVQYYLYDLKLKRVETAAEYLDEMREAARVAATEAIKSKTRATAALIISGGAMLAAMLAAFVAFLALQHWPW